jgi:hypothetical protein
MFLTVLFTMGIHIDNNLAIEAKYAARRGERWAAGRHGELTRGKEVCSSDDRGAGNHCGFKERSQPSWVQGLTATM